MVATLLEWVSDLQTVAMMLLGHPASATCIEDQWGIVIHPWQETKMLETLKGREKIGKISSFKFNCIIMHVGSSSITICE